MRALVRLFPAALLVVLSACGGSGSAGTVDPIREPEPFVISGEYHLVNHLQTGSGQFTMVGRATAGADGSLNGSMTVNDGGVVVPGPLPFESTFQTQPDGTFRWGLGLGSASPDGRVVATFASGSLGLLVRRDGIFDLASLVGTYRFASLFGAPLSGTVSSFGGTLVFDGLGGWTMDAEFVNEEGVHGPVGGTPTGTYGVTPGGELAFDTPTLKLTGGVALDGELLILGGGGENGQPPMALIAVREGSGRDDASLQGAYTVASHRIAPTTHEPRGKLGVLTASAGSAEWLAVYPDLAIGEAAVSLPVVYTVSPEGRLDLRLDGEDYRGALSSSGDVAFLVGGVTDGEDPALLALVRRRAIPTTGDAPLNPAQSASIDETRGVWVVGAPDLLQVVLTSRRIRVGETRTEAVVLTTEGLRAPLRFDLRALRAGETVVRATLVTTQDAVEGAPYAALGELLVDHVDLGSRLTRTDFDAPRLPLGTIGVLSRDPSLGPRSLDVTDAVLVDLAAGRITSDFLLHFTVRENGDPLVDRVVLDDHQAPGPSTGPRTKLVITYR